MVSRLAAVFILRAFEQVAGHGWITSPAPRQKGLAAGCEHCLSGSAICGSNSYMDVFKGPQATWREGSVVEVTVRVTAHHMGHYEFSICDQRITSSTPNAQACLDAHILERASAQEAGIFDCRPGDSRAACQPIDDRHKERFYLPPGGFSENNDNSHTFYLKLPAGLACSECTMQWRWWTANSCIPAPDYACFKETLAANGYTNSDRWGLTNWAVKSCPGGGCNRCSCGEEFRNCVDVSIESNGGVVPTRMPTPMPTTTTPAPAPTTTTTTTMASGCTVVPINGKTWGATVAKCEKTCPVMNAGEWPCRKEGPCVCGSAPRPSPMPTPAPTMRPTPSPTRSPTPMPTPSPTPSSGAGECKANRAVNRGVSDNHCAQCKTGYQWWPCNEKILCVGDGCQYSR